MNKDELKGKMENLKGRAEQAVGAMSGDKRKEGEGLVDRVKGAVREKVGKAKDEVARETPADEPEVSREDRSVSREEDEDE